MALWIQILQISVLYKVLQAVVKYYSDQRFIGQLIARGEDSCRYYTRLHIATDITRVATDDDIDASILRRTMMSKTMAIAMAMAMKILL